MNQEINVLLEQVKKERSVGRRKKILKKALKIDPNNITVLKEMITEKDYDRVEAYQALLIKIEDGQDVLKLYQAFNQDMFDDYIKFRLEIAEFLLKLGRFHAAIEMFKKLLSDVEKVETLEFEIFDILMPLSKIYLYLSCYDELDELCVEYKYAELHFIQLLLLIIEDDIDAAEYYYRLLQENTDYFTHFDLTSGSQFANSINHLSEDFMANNGEQVSSSKNFLGFLFTDSEDYLSTKTRQLYRGFAKLEKKSKVLHSVLIEHIPGITSRALTSLKAFKIESIDDLREYEEEFILFLHGIGPKTVEKLRKYGAKFKGE